MERQFALRWIAYEGLVRRTAIKALWMRGAMVREAQKTINQLQGPEWENPTLLLGNCGTYISIPLFKTLQERAHIRNLLFHQLDVATKKGHFKRMTDLLGFALANPSAVFGDIKVHVGGTRPQYAKPSGRSPSQGNRCKPYSVMTLQS